MILNLMNIFDHRLFNNLNIYFNQNLIILFFNYIYSKFKD